VVAAIGTGERRHEPTGRGDRQARGQVIDHLRDLLPMWRMHASDAGKPHCGRTHHNEDELWFVLVSEFRFKAGDTILRASTGGMAFGPRSTPHCFQNIGDQAGRLLVVTTPEGWSGSSKTSRRDCPGASALAATPGVTGQDLVVRSDHARQIDLMRQST